MCNPLMAHCHFPEGEWSATVYCPVFVHNAPTEGEDMESERREWGVSPHAAKGKGDITRRER